MKKFFIILLICALAIPVLAQEKMTTIGRDVALSELRSGNLRYVAGQPRAWAAGAQVREELVKGQHPRACVITCSDSRVSPEILFDQSIGDLFVIRLAGNVVSPEVVGSVEYAVEHLHVPVVVVLGHSGCGAVAAAMSDANFEGPLASIITKIRPAIETAKQKGYAGDDLPAAVVTENARRAAEGLLQGSRAVDEAVNDGGVAVLSAVYDLQSGRVSWQTQMCSAPMEAPVAATPAVDKKAVADAPKTDTPKATTASAEGAKSASGTGESLTVPNPAPKKVVKETSAYARRH